MTFHFHRYDILKKRWSRSFNLPGTKTGFVATSVNNKICYVDRSDESIKFIEGVVTSRTLENRINRNEIKQMVSNKDQLYVASCNAIEKYDFSTKTWTMVIK